MNSSNKILLAALTGVALTFTAAFAQAEIKGGEKLVQLNGSAVATAAAPSDYKAMSCPKCQDLSTSVRDLSAKGATALATHGAVTKAVASHGCESCATTTSTTGTGKHTKDVVTHTCAMSMSCCSPAK